MSKIKLQTTPEMIASVEWAHGYALSMADMLHGGKKTGKEEFFRDHATQLAEALALLKSVPYPKGTPFGPLAMKASALWLQGRSMKEIALELGIERRTINYYSLHNRKAFPHRTKEEKSAMYKKGWADRAKHN